VKERTTEGTCGKFFSSQLQALVILAKVPFSFCFLVSGALRHSANDLCARRSNQTDGVTRERPTYDRRQTIKAKWREKIERCKKIETVWSKRN
jgi:hypothetical protein